ncbi:MAG TPA: cytosine permease, partial [Glaciihabitans sp.]|nr:cytosine permease [Glaciihabitans sp.]
MADDHARSGEPPVSDATSELFDDDDIAAALAEQFAKITGVPSGTSTLEPGAPPVTSSVSSRPSGYTAAPASPPPFVPPPLVEPPALPAAPLAPLVPTSVRTAQVSGIVPVTRTPPPAVQAPTSAATPEQAGPEQAAPAPAEPTSTEHDQTEQPSAVSAQPAPTSPAITAVTRAEPTLSTAMRSRVAFDALVTGAPDDAHDDLGPAEPEPTSNSSVADAPPQRLSRRQRKQQARLDNARDFDDLFGSAHPGTASSTVIPAGSASETAIPWNLPLESAGIDARPLPVFPPEPFGAEPTPLEHRAGQATRMFWLWFAANSSLVSVAFGAVVFSLGMSLRQSMVAVLAGVALSFVPIAVGTVAGKRTGAPAMIASRATFGLAGNLLPATLSLISRLFWGATLLWILGAGTASILAGTPYAGSFGPTDLTLIALGIGAALATLIAVFGYALLVRVQAVLSILSAILVVGFIALTVRFVNIPTALTVPDSSWLVSLSGAILVFSFLGLVWANSAPDLARYQRPFTSAGAAATGATIGSALPSFVLIGYGALLAASDPTIAATLLDQPVAALGLLLPSWYPLPLVAATALSLLSGVIITMYSAGFALQSVGVRMPRAAATLLTGLALTGLA